MGAIVVLLEVVGENDEWGYCVLNETQSGLALRQRPAANGRAGCNRVFDRMMVTLVKSAKLKRLWGGSIYLSRRVNTMQRSEPFACP